MGKPQFIRILKTHFKIRTYRDFFQNFYSSKHSHFRSTFPTFPQVYADGTLECIPQTEHSTSTV